MQSISIVSDIRLSFLASCLHASYSSIILLYKLFVLIIYAICFLLHDIVSLLNLIFLLSGYNHPRILQAITDPKNLVSQYDDCSSSLCWLRRKGSQAGFIIHAHATFSCSIICIAWTVIFSVKNFGFLFCCVSGNLSGSCLLSSYWCCCRLCLPTDRLLVSHHQLIG